MGFAMGTPFSVNIFGITLNPEPLSDNTELSRSNGYYRSKGEFGVKALMDDAFALLYIPRNAAVHVGRNTDSDSYYLNSGRGNEDGRFDPENKNALKHRASRAYVVDICKLSVSKSSTSQEAEARMTLNRVTRGCSMHDHGFFYKPGEWLEIKNYEYRVDDECNSGIHYFPYAGAAARYTYHDQIVGMTRGYGKTIMGFDFFMANMSMRFALAKNLLCKWAEESEKEFKEHSPIFEADHDTKAAVKDYLDSLTAAFYEWESELEAFRDSLYDHINLESYKAKNKIVGMNERLAKKLIEDTSDKNKPP